MKYTKQGLVNTNEMFADAIAGKYAIPAFNIYNMETLISVLDAARAAHSPAILGVSESALKYMGGDMLMAMIGGAKIGIKERITAKKGINRHNGTIINIRIIQKAI